MRAEKQFLLDEIKEKIDVSQGFIVTRYQSLTPNKSREFRRMIRGAHGEFEVVKKRVFLKALEFSGITFNTDALDGHVGIIFAKSDAAALTKVAVKYGKENDQALEILGGKIENEVYSGADMKAISALPTMQELRSQFLSVLEAPMGNIVSIFDAHLSGVLNCIEQKSKKEQ